MPETTMPETTMPETTMPETTMPETATPGATMSDEKTMSALPEPPSITPAPEDNLKRAPRGALLWPLLWIGLATAIWASVRALGWTPFTHG